MRRSISIPRSTQARAFVLFAAVFVLAACRSPLYTSADRADITLSFTVSSGAARLRGLGASSRLLLPPATRLTVALIPERADAPTPDPETADLREPGESCPVTFLNVLLGRYTIVAEAADSGGSVLYRRALAVELRAGANAWSLTLLPVPPGGGAFDTLAAGVAVSGTLEPGASMTWAIPDADGATGHVVLRAASGVRLFCQDADGAIMNDDPLSRRVSDSADAGFATIYNAGSSSEAYAIVFGVSPLVARWQFDNCDEETDDFVDSVGGTETTVHGSSLYTAPGSGYRSNGALYMSSSSYLSLGASPYAGLEAPWSVLAWVASYASDEALPILSDGSGTCIYAAKDPSYSIAVSSGGSTYAFPSSVDTEGAWTHVAIVNTGSEMRLYVNGAMAGSAVVDPAVVGMRLPLGLIGSDDAGAFFDGTLDDLRVYQTAVGEAEIVAVASSASVKELSINYAAHGSVTVSPDQTYFNTGTQATLTAVPEDATWQFKEWSGDASGAENPLVVTMDSDKAITPVFETAVPRYFLRYDTNGGSYTGTDGLGTATPTDVYELVSGSELQVHSSGCSVEQTADPTLYFTGWNTQADGLGTDYLPGATIIITGDTTLYACWKPDDGPDATNRATASLIDPTPSTPVQTPGFIQFNGDYDFFRIDIPAGAGGTILLELSGVTPALFTAILYNADLSSYNGTGWSPSTGYSSASMGVSGGATYYVGVSHQNQAYHSGSIRTGSYTITTTYTPN